MPKSESSEQMYSGSLAQSVVRLETLTPLQLRHYYSYGLAHYGLTVHFVSGH